MKGLLYNRFQLVRARYLMWLSFLRRHSIPLDDILVYELGWKSCVIAESCRSCRVFGAKALSVAGDFELKTVVKDTLIVLLAKTTLPLSPQINSPGCTAHMKGLTYLNDYGFIRTCLGGAM